MTKVIFVFSLPHLVLSGPAVQHGPMFFHYTPAHITNIVCHILGGSLAIIAGVVAILARKQSLLHARAGMTFVWAYSLVIFTAVMGVVVFEFRSFLAVATIASSYSLFSGFRATCLRGRHPSTLDRGAAVLGIIAPALFLAAMHILQKPWAPVLTWTVLGSLIGMSSYDLLRSALPASWLEKTWVPEHIFKMIGAFDALTATFAATIFPHLQPWSALIPNLFGTALILTFIAGRFKHWRSRQEQLPSLLASLSTD